MLNNFSSKCIKMAKRFAFGTSYGITHFNSGIKVRPSLGKACTNFAMFSVLSYQPLDKANSCWPVCSNKLSAGAPVPKGLTSR